MGLSVQAEDTPCGRLNAANAAFMELTYHTRAEVALGARAACLLRLAAEHDAPLAVVRGSFPLSYRIHCLIPSYNPPCNTNIA